MSQVGEHLAGRQIDPVHSHVGMLGTVGDGHDEEEE